MPLPLLIAHPDPAADAAFANLLRGTEYVPAGIARNGRELADALWKTGPWGALLDLSLPDHADARDFGWCGAARRIREIAPAVRVVATFDRRRYPMVHAAVAGGAAAFAERPIQRDELLAALEHAASGRPPMPFFARSRRVPARLSVFVRAAQAGDTAAVRQVVVENVSDTGALLRCPGALPRKTVLSCEIELPDRSTVRVRAQSLRSLPSPAGGFGVGVSFIEFEPGHQDRLAAFVARGLGL
jgi:DNA-binding NarL/FixJ family response regulator